MQGIYSTLHFGTNAPMCSQQGSAYQHIGARPPLSTITIIPYNTNILADLSLWNKKFGATSLFGTNKFLQSDINNMAISLQYMATFLR